MILILHCSVLISFLFTTISYGQEPIQVNSWSYWLQNISIPELTASNYDLVVIDYSADGTQSTAFTSDEIASLKNSDKVVLSYLSIGEAEEVRFYFKSSWVKDNKKTSTAPRWLELSNPKFPDNYKVRYWDKKWQKIIFGIESGENQSYLDRIIQAGFDGVYLDIIDAFEDRKLAKVETRHGVKRGKRRNAIAMAKFVIALSRYARTFNPDFQVFPQNGSAIIEYLPESLRLEYFSVINGIGAEDTFYFGDEEEDNSLNPQDYTISLLDAYISAGKRVLAIDYLLDSNKISNFASLACSHGFIPQVSNRELDTLLYHRELECL